MMSLQRAGLHACDVQLNTHGLHAHDRPAEAPSIHHAVAPGLHEPCRSQALAPKREYTVKAYKNLLAAVETAKGELSEDASGREWTARSIEHTAFAAAVLGA